VVLHPFHRSKVHLLEGLPSVEEAMADPASFARIVEFWTPHDATPPPVVDIRGAEAPGPHGPVPLRVYSPPGDALEGRPGLVLMHGGAFRAGDLDDPGTDRIAREVCARAGAVIVSVDYRLAVNGVCYPVPHDDVVAALRWVRNAAASLGIDSLRLSLAGSSAGANLAAGAALRLRDDDGWLPAALLLVVPIVHPVLPPPSKALAAVLPDVPAIYRFLPEGVETMNRNYVGGPASAADGYAMPVLAYLGGLCPTVVINAEYDDLRSSGEAFVAALALAGVDVQQVTLPGMLHPFTILPSSVQPVERALALLARVVSTADRAATDSAGCGQGSRGQEARRAESA
jgi:acetyl esterase